MTARHEHNIVSGSAHRAPAAPTLQLREPSRIRRRLRRAHDSVCASHCELERGPRGTDITHVHRDQDALTYECAVSQTRILDHSACMPLLSGSIMALPLFADGGAAMAEAWLDSMIEEIRSKEIELNNL